MSVTRDRNGLHSGLMQDLSAFSLSSEGVGISTKLLSGTELARPAWDRAYQDNASSGLKNASTEAPRAARAAVAITSGHNAPENVVERHPISQSESLYERLSLSNASATTGSHTSLTAGIDDAMSIGETSSWIGSLVASPMPQLNADIVHSNLGYDRLSQGQSRQGGSDFGGSHDSHAGAAPPPAGGVSGQLWIGFGGPGVGNPNGHSDFAVLHADADGLSNDVVVTQEQVSTGLYQAVGLDTSAGIFISMDNSYHMRVTNMATGANLSTTTIASTADQDIFNCFVVNADTNTIYGGLFGYDYLTNGGDLLKIGYNQTTGAISNPYTFSDATHTGSVDLNQVLISSASTGNVYADTRAMVLSSDKSTIYYVDDNDNDPGNFWHFSTNAIFRVSASGSVGGGDAPTPVKLSDQAQFPVNDSNGYITGIAVDEAHGIIYFTTNSSNPAVNTSQNAIWWMPITGGMATKMTPVGVTVTYPYFIGELLAFDPSTRQLYYSDQTTGIISRFQIDSTGHAFSSGGTFLNFDTATNFEGAGDLGFNVLPTLGSLSATTMEAVQGGSAITLLTATPAISDPDNLRLNHMTVTITNAQAGDNLFCNGGQSGTFSGVTVNWNSSTHTLTLSGDVAFSTYQTLMSQISFRDDGTDNSTGSHPTRTINWTISDGVTIGHPSTNDSNQQTTTVVIDRAPTSVADNYTVVETATVTGTSGTAGTGVLGNDSDKDADAIAVTQVNGGGGNVGSSVAGTYGHLTLNANGSYSYIADNAAAIAAAATGSHLTDTFTYTVSDGLGGGSLSTVTFTLDRIPTVVADNPAGQALESGSPVTGNVLSNDSDRDGDSLVVSAVNGSGGGVGVSVAGTYGEITINANGSYSYAADNIVAIDGAATGSHLTDTFTYTASDGHGGTTTTSIVITLDRGPTAVNDSFGSQVVEGGSTGAVSAANGVLHNDSDRDGDTLVVSAIGGGSVGGSTATTYGHITLNADGSYSYTADNIAAIDGAATGAHLTDTVSFTVSDGHGGTASETLSITLDRLAVATGDSLSTTETTQAVSGSGGNANLLDNDTDRDGDAIVITQVNGSAGHVGSQFKLASGAFLTVNADGTYTYDPHNAFNYLAAAGSGASDTTATDSFTYTIDGGSMVTVTITIAGVDGNDVLIGTTGIDTIHGGAGADIFFDDNGARSGIDARDTSAGHSGGNDALSGDIGNDRFFMGANLTAGVSIDGGTGNDRVFLDGDYTSANALVFTSTTMVNVEALSLAAGNSYSLTTDDATVAAGKTLTIQAGTLGVGDNVTFDGGAETNGRFVINTGAGNDALTGGGGNDIFRSGAGTDTIHAGGGNDTINMGANLTAADTIDGGSGHDTLELAGDYSSALTFGSTTMTNIEMLQLKGGFDYDLILNGLNVTSGQTLSVKAISLGAGDNLTFDASAVTGNVVISSGAGNDTLSGGSGDDVIKAGAGTNLITGNGGADTLTGGSGHDTFVYNQAADSTSTAYDRVVHFDADNDTFQINGFPVNAIDTAVTRGVLNLADFDTDLAGAITGTELGAHDAILFTANRGDLHGHTFLIVDLNGTAGYQAGQDLVIDITGAANLNNLTTTNFTH